MDIQVFNNEQFGALRTYEEDGRILFCGKDVAKALGYAKPNNAINSHCKGALKRCPLQTAGGVQEFVFITEPDLYRLITHSKLPEVLQNTYDKLIEIFEDVDGIKKD